MNRTSTLPDMSTAIAALTTRADGTIDDPQTTEEWDAWVSASTTRNHLKGDPLHDWLHRYGAANGFQRDDEVEGSDPRTDFLAFIFAQGQRFEDGVMQPSVGWTLHFASSSTSSSGRRAEPVLSDDHEVSPG